MVFFMSLNYFFSPEFVIDLQSRPKKIQFWDLFCRWYFRFRVLVRHTRFLDANNEIVSPQDAFVIVFGIEKNII